MFLDHGYTHCETEPREEKQSLNVVLDQGCLGVFEILKPYENMNQTLFTFQITAIAWRPLWCLKFLAIFTLLFSVGIECEQTVFILVLLCCKKSGPIL